MQSQPKKSQQRLLHINPGIATRFILALVATVSSILLAWTLMFSQPYARAFGLNEYPTTEKPWGIAFDYVNGYIWVAEPGCNASPVCSSPPPGSIGRFSLANPGAGEKNFAPQFGRQYNPGFIRTDKNKHLWFTDPTHNLIGELVPKGDQWASWTVPTTNAAPYDLVFDHFGDLWFTEYNANNVAEYNPTNHVIVENAIPTSNSAPYGMTIDKQGKIWFTESGTHQIGSFLPDKTGKLGPGAIKEYPVSTSASPHELSVDATGNIWYSEGSAGQVGMFNPLTNQYKEYKVSSSICPTPTPNTTPPACTGTFVAGINIDSKGFVWFDDALAAVIGRLDPTTGKVSKIHLPSGSAYPYDSMEIDKQNNVWFTELNNNNLGEVPQSGAPTPTPTK